MAPTLLVELFTEELPPKALKRLGEAFAEGITAGLRERGFLSADSKITVFATPRRLALTLTDVNATSPDQPVRQKILPVSVAFDAAGNPTPALEKKLAGLGISDPRMLIRDSDGRGEVLFHEGIKPGVTLGEGLQAAYSVFEIGAPMEEVLGACG